MKQNYIKLMLSVLLCIATLSVSAHDFEVDGIYYNITSSQDLTVAITYRGSFSDSFNEYSGQVSIPETVVYNEKTYRVTSIGDYAFAYCSGLTSVTIPNSVTSIGYGAFMDCSCLTSVTIPNSVTRIENITFYGCSSLTNVTIPSSVNYIGSAFQGCDNLTKVILNSNHIVSVNRTTSTSLKSVFGENVKEYVLGDDVTNIGSYAFYDCCNLTKVIISESVTRIGKYAFNRCSGLANVIIPNGVIEEWAFASCGGLTNVTIGNGVTTIKQNAFNRCTDLSSVTMGNGVTTIEYYAFMDCSKITKVITHDIAAWCSIQFNASSSNPLYYAKHLYSDEDTEIRDLIIPDGVTSISNFAFYSCSGLTNITFPDGITTIGASAFFGCSGLTTIIIPSSVVTIGESAFMDCELTKVVLNSSHVVSKNYGTKDKQLKDIFGQVKEYVLGDGIISVGNYAFWASGVEKITLPNSLINIGWYAFYFNLSLKNIIIPERVTFIGGSAFEGCWNLSSVNIPSSVKTIEDYAFVGCNIYTVTIPDSVIYIGKKAFDMKYGIVRDIYANKGTTSILALWSAGYQPKDINTRIVIPVPLLTTEATQTTLSATIDNYYDDFSYSASYKYPNYESDKGTITSNITVNIPDTTVFIEGLCPDFCPELSVRISKDDANYTIFSEDKALSIGPVVLDSVTATSILAACSWIKGDAVVDSVKIIFNGEEIYSDSIELHGLDPEQSYGLLQYGVRVVYGSHTDAKKWYWTNKNIRTASLSMTTLVPKVISAGNVIVSAETNIDDEEMNVGFEWRRTDWTDEFASKTGGAALYEGVMEGYIRSLYTEKLWKYRPYYLSDSGVYHYGDWMGIDPTDVSYFEPTVHTYEKINLNGNTAMIKGYAMQGTDGIKLQGFVYWPEVAGAKPCKTVANVPSDATTVEASGQVMTATLSDLAYITTYSYAAFVTTKEGDTFYGEQQTFTTGNDPNIVMGDINNDGKVDVSDYIGIANRILGQTPEGFNEQAADVNGDGVIDVSDYIGVANIILTGSIYGSQTNATSRTARRP